MRFLIRTLLILSLIVGASVPARPYTLQYLDSSGARQLRWASNTITIALSTSLQNPPSNFAPNSDLVGAAQRALAHWSEAANVQFIVTTSSAQSISAGDSGGDGINLITVANTPDNIAFFPAGVEVPGRTRNFNDGKNTVESDIAINPALPFSTDGTPNTYDFEAVLTHEIGHLLGLEHSGVISATMQPRFARNGLFNLPTLTPRTLSDDDRAGIRAIYGTLDNLGSIQGSVQMNGAPVYGAHVWAEDVATGRVRASSITFANGSYRIDGLPAGQYRLTVEALDEPVNVTEIPTTTGAYADLRQSASPPFKTYEVPNLFAIQPSAQPSAAPNSVAGVNISIPPSPPSFNPSFVGRDGQLSTVAVPLVPGRKTTVYIGGSNLTPSVIPPSGISIISPFFTVDQSSVSYTQFGSVPIISFDVAVSSIAPPGDYSIRLAASSGDVSYLCGALTVDLPFGVASGNPITDDSAFFVAQHYRDFLNREPDQDGLNFWTNQIASCQGDASCIDIKRQNVSAAYFLSTEFQQTGFFVIRAQRAAFGKLSQDSSRRISYRQFINDASVVGSGVVIGQPNAAQQLEQNKTNYAQSIVLSSDFVSKYPRTLSAAQFVDALFATAGVQPSAQERQDAIAAFGAGDTAGRAAALRKVAESASLTNAEFNPAFVLMQYFGYLRRDADAAGFNFWLQKLNQFNGNYIAAEMVRSFIVSDEYKQRFGK